MSGNNFMESSPFLLLFVLGYCLAVTEGELRCYCNESGCVATGYMCKSSAGQCFTSLEIRGQVTHQTHGCLDSLSADHRRSCQDIRNNKIISSGRVGHLPLLLCCSEHMCNYRDDALLTPKHNGTYFRTESVPAKEDSAIFSRNPHSSRDDDRDLWFKAAVIAVPIAGGFILVLLVLLAVRMLRTDSRHHRRLIQIRRERSLTKAHMFISEHFPGKISARQHCSLFDDKVNSTCVPLYRNESTTSSDNKSSNAWKPSCLSDSVNSYRSYLSPKLESALLGDINVNSSSSPSESTLIYKNTSHVTCSTGCDSYSKTNGNDKPCSPSEEFLAETLPRDMSVNIDKDGHTVPHITKLVSKETFSRSGQRNSHDRAQEKACSKGPADVV